VTQANATAESGQTATLPIFYSRPRPLDAVADRDRSLGPITDFRFARATNSVLLGAAEYPCASRSPSPRTWSEIASSLRSSQ